ncbi:HPP family protein [Phyllobacterium sp. 21LDTY02-6]|uniref:HPP family protein n=1 Tax=unclassified Phyllobacterium TaxID=2638441 RepID=UPI0020208CCC|nr:MULTISPECIES: HPP family protein [unclassified Phyllobacterium]MCO4318408.1 HPP family protein [Phyllobacterium sp. 21LDTY02-6]MCX8281328.1 HPP family protein [Phyllobacterium sp. 0TCS1.6C]MCX8296016.1 HPP family protein [Phyllobacterium sp. 0TCS1.6A]
MNMNRSSFRIFQPILAGATLRDRIIGCVGALVGIGLTGYLCGLSMGDGFTPMIVAPIGASAVLLFAVPASPLAQPWPIIGGNTISALVGVTVSHFVAEPAIAIALAVALAIAAMSVTRSLHPPGGAAALTAVIGGSAVTSAGFYFPFFPVAVNSVLLVGLGILFHRLSRRSYPHVAPAPVNIHGTADEPPILRAGFRSEDVDAALETMHETFDIDRKDIEELLRQVQRRALARGYRPLTCKDIMSRDVIRLETGESAGKARQLLIDHNIRTLPLVDDGDRLAGTVGLRELIDATGSVADVMAPPQTASPDSPALDLLDILTSGRVHAVVVIDEERHIKGLVTQTDLLAALAARPSGR